MIMIVYDFQILIQINNTNNTTFKIITNLYNIINNNKTKQ